MIKNDSHCDFEYNMYIYIIFCMNLIARFVKDGASVLTKPIVHIINLSIEQNVVPNNSKNARVVPLFKKNKRSEVGNYRPVSVLSVVSKILERAVYTQLEEYLVDKKLLFDFQSGFRSIWGKQNVYSLALKEN